jgi:hypothetical protein
MSDGLAKAREASRLLREQGISTVRLSPKQKSLLNPKSLRFAVTAHCWERVGGAQAENARKEVADCTLEGKCMLWPFRPWQHKADSDSAQDD